MKLWLGWLLAGGMVVGLGCGDGRPERVPVKGTVWVDGKPLAGDFTGSIRLLPVAGGRPAVGMVDANGTFVLGNYDANDGCPPGEYRVEVTATLLKMPNLVRYWIPPRYASAETSGLTVTITDGKEPLKIETQWLPEEEKWRGKFLPQGKF